VEKKVKNLKSRSLLKKIPFMVLIVVVIAFFAIPSFIFAEGEGTATIETTQTAVVQNALTDSSTETSGTTMGPTDTEQPATAEVTTTSGQMSETDVIDTDETITTEAPASETMTTEQAAAETLVNTETQDNEGSDLVNTEAVYSPLISTDKADYNPGETVTVFGTGFKPGDEIELTFYNAAGEIEFAGLVIANEQGNFIYTYSILGSAEYKLTAKSLINNISATTDFLDSAVAHFDATGPKMAGNQFYEERMDMHVILNDGLSTSVPMYAFCIDLQHYLDTGGTWDVIGFNAFNATGQIDTTLVAWPLPANVYALARSLDPAWLNIDSDGFTMAQKAAAVQEAFWTLISAANSTDNNTFNYITNGIKYDAKIQGLVAALIGRANSPQAQVSSLAITPISDLNYLQDDINLNKHDLNITAKDYLGNAINGVLVNVTVTGKGFFDTLNKTIKSITAISGTTISLYADKSDYLGVNIGTDLISGYVDVNGDQNIDPSSLPVNVSTDLIGSILWPNNRSFPQSTTLPWGSNQMLILTGLYEPQAQAIKEWRIPGEITVHKSDGVDSIGLAGAVISLLDGNGNQAKDAWGNAIADQTTDTNGDILGFEGLAWGNYQIKESTAPSGYNLAANVPVAVATTVNSITTSLNTEVKMVDTRIPGQFRLTKTDSVTKLPVASAIYNIYDSSGKLVEIITTGSDGSVAVTLQNWGTYTVKEFAAPTGYNLDPASYSVTFNASNTNVTLNVSDSPVVTGGGTPTVTVAGITESVQVLAFTGQDPIIPIAGLAAVIAGLAMVIVTFSRRMAPKWKHAIK
jgi:uncharacterized surface anchored protein